MAGFADVLLDAFSENSRFTPMLRVGAERDW